MTAGEDTGAATLDPRPAAEVEAEAGLPTLPAPVRSRVLALAAEALGSLPGDEVPPALRPFARFTPARRARLAAGPLAQAVERDALLRQRLAARVREAVPAVAEALAAGQPVPAADPVDVAAAAYLLRPPGWARAVADACAEVVRDRELAGSRDLARELDRLRDDTQRARAAADAETERLRAELTAARAEADGLRRRLREEIGAVRKAAASAGEEALAARRERDAALASAATAEAEARRARARAEQAESALDAARRARREGRDADDVRLRMLLDTLLGAAQGLRRELALAPVEGRPADAVAAAVEAEAGAATPDSDARGLAADDPVGLARLLALPAVHLLVDGYNVTMSAYGDLPLEAQRGRLLTGLGALAARTGAEVTCVFDGVGRVTPLALAAPRGVRLLFSPPEVTADEVIRRLVRQEPRGRPVVVVSSDREVADGVRRSGAHPVPSPALVRLLERP